MVRLRCLNMGWLEVSLMKRRASRKILVLVLILLSLLLLLLCYCFIIIFCEMPPRFCVNVDNIVGACITYMTTTLEELNPIDTINQLSRG